MPFGTFGAGDRITIRMLLRGAQQYVAGMKESALATQKLAAAQLELEGATKGANRQRFLQNQLLFTERRLAFYGTLAVLGLGAAVVKLGLSYYNTKQQAEVALAAMLPQDQLKTVMNQLFSIAAYTPFTFQQVTQAFRSIFVGFQQLGLSATYTENTLRNIIDALSLGGFLTEQNVRRVSNALQDLAYQGTLTQRMVTRLGQLNIPFRQALSQTLGLTEAQMQNIGRLRIPAKTAIDALNQYIRTSRIFKDAALNQATKTLYGAWTTFRDFLSQAAGGSGGGIFGRLQKALINIDKGLNDITKTGRTLTFGDVVRAIDKELTPKTHLVINLFTLIDNAIQGVVDTIGILAKVVGTVLLPLEDLSVTFDANITAAKLLGKTVGVLTGLLIINKLALYGWDLIINISTALIKGLQMAVRLLVGEEGLLTLIAVLKDLRKIMIGSDIANSRLVFQIQLLLEAFKRKGLVGAIVDTYRALLLLVLGEQMATASTWELTTALLANPITWIVIAVIALTAGLALLVIKVQAVNHRLKENFWWFSMIIMLVMGPLGLWVNLVITLSLYWDKIANAIKAAYEWMRKLVTLKWAPGLGGGGGGFLSRLGNVLSYSPLNPLLGPRLIARGVTGHQHGGMASGYSWVGEGGPELVKLPQGSQVFNRTQLAAGFAGGGGLNITIIPQDIIIDREKIGQVLARVVTDRKARL